MTILSVDDMIEATGAKIYLPEGSRLSDTVEKVVIDTRQINGSALFVAFKGGRVDGHDYLSAAAEKGALIAMVESEQPVAMPQLVVHSCEAAIRLLALAARKAFKGKVIAITGSSGKTSTKEMLVTILSQKYPVSFTQGNQNNELGLPLTLINMSQESDFTVVEMGARKPLDIKNLMAFAMPDVSVVTNVGFAHVGIFGDQQHIADAKSEVYFYLKKSGCAVLNRDDDYFYFMLTQCKKIHETFSFSKQDPDADLYASDLFLEAKRSTFMLNYQQQSEPCTLSMSGEYAVINSLCAAACAVALGINDLSLIVTGLSDVKAIEGRSCELSGYWGGVLIDDTYNANPLSMRAAIDALSLRLERKILVLGDMAELGEKTNAFHREVLMHAIEKSIDKIFVTGPLMQAAAMRVDASIQAFLSKDDLLLSLQAVLQQHDVVLLKGSRYLAMDALIEPLIEKDDTACC